MIMNYNHICMDILYYSNYCKHSSKLLQYLAKNNLVNKLNCICIDNRIRDPKTQQTYVVLEKGTRVLLPPNVHSVPSLLLVNQKYSVITGETIYQYFEPQLNLQNNIATQNDGEPLGFVLSSNNGMNIVSEQFTYYNMSPDELSAKGKGNMRQMYNYVNATHENLKITAPEETYRSNKLRADDISLDDLQRKRDMDIGETMRPPNLSDIGNAPGNIAVMHQSQYI
jgi:hypothetical protein